MEALQERLRDIASQEDALDVQASMFIKPLCLFKPSSDDSPASRKVHLLAIETPTWGATNNWPIKVYNQNENTN